MSVAWLPPPPVASFVQKNKRSVCTDVLSGPPPVKTGRVCPSEGGEVCFHTLSTFFLKKTTTEFFHRQVLSQERRGWGSALAPKCPRENTPCGEKWKKHCRRKVEKSSKLRQIWSSGTNYRFTNHREATSLISTAIRRELVVCLHSVW